ncbi:DUF2256 domain-containing protein [Acidocella sp.]|uniref:DUF2256 domain-containing protein n=2 Tax=Acidocella sp. TaxID=50710 RepID=UPI0034122B23
MRRFSRGRAGGQWAGRPSCLALQTVAMHRKPHLPSKPCAQCARPFTWRKKWARVWDEVKFCSERCKRAHRAGGSERLADRG